MPTQDAGTPVPTSALELIAKSLEQQNQIIANQQDLLVQLRAGTPPRNIGYSDADYQAAMRMELRAWKTPTYQNGREADPSGETDQTIDRVRGLKAGLYLKGTVEVEVSPKGAVNFVYKNKTPDQRMARQLDFTTFGELVDKVWAEMQMRAVSVT